MSTLTEQFSAVRKSQLESQIKFFQSFTAKALDSAQKIIALNLSVSRASMEKSSAAMVDLLAAQDPRDLFALTARTQQSLDGLLAYNRELIAIATGAAQAAKSPEAKAAPLALALPAADVPESAPAAAEFVAPLAVDAPPAAPPEAKAKPVAKAVGKVAAKPAAAAIAPPQTPVVVTGIKPVDAAPPPAAAQQQLDLPAKTKKKK